MESVDVRHHCLLSCGTCLGHLAHVYWSPSFRCSVCASKDLCTAKVCLVIVSTYMSFSLQEPVKTGQLQKTDGNAGSSNTSSDSLDCVTSAQILNIIHATRYLLSWW